MILLLTNRHWGKPGSYIIKKDDTYYHFTKGENEFTKEKIKWIHRTIVEHEFDWKLIDEEWRKAMYASMKRSNILPEVVTLYNNESDVMYNLETLQELLNKITDESRTL